MKSMKIQTQIIFIFFKCIDIGALLYYNIQRIKLIKKQKLKTE